MNKIYKYKITFLIGLLISGLCFAQTSTGTKVIYSNAMTNSRGDEFTNLIPSSKGAPSAAHQKCLNWVHDIHAEWILNIGKAAAETECSVVTPKVTITSNPFRYTGRKCKTLLGCSTVDAGPGVEYTVRYEVNCQRRPLGESQAMHQFHLCKTNPSAQCVSPEYLNYINSVALTQYNDVDASACNQLNSAGGYSTAPYTNNNDNYGFR